MKKSFLESSKSAKEFLLNEGENSKYKETKSGWLLFVDEIHNVKNYYTGKTYGSIIFLSKKDWSLEEVKNIVKFGASHLSDNIEEVLRGQEKPWKYFVKGSVLK